MFGADRFGVDGSSATRWCAGMAVASAAAAVGMLAVTAPVREPAAVATAPVLAAVRAATRPPSVALKVANLAPDPDFLTDGKCPADSGTSSCATTELAAIAHARKIEGLKPMSISLKDWAKLTLAEQVFAVTNLERTARHLAPVSAMTRQLDSLALAAARAGTDPSGPTTVTGGGVVVAAGGNFALGFVNALGTDYGWMYWDGPGGPNVDCSSAGAPGCYGHRDNVLRDWAATGGCAAGQASHVYAGTADDTSRISTEFGSGKPSITELFVRACAPAATDVVATWSQIEKLLGI